ncbi:MAG: flagellar M-ring protein FliF, partial [Thermodesulfatator sp.]
MRTAREVRDEKGRVLCPAGTELTPELLERLAKMGVSYVTVKGHPVSFPWEKSLEEELSQSISALRNIKSARVHLAIPKESVFVRNRKKPSASVIVDLYSGHRISDEQVSAISYMVASSVPNLQVEEVTIVDQMGRLLTDKNDKQAMLNSEQLEYASKVEQNYIDRVSNILTPFLGRQGFKAQVSAALD